MRSLTGQVLGAALVVLMATVTMAEQSGQVPIPALERARAAHAAGQPEAAWQWLSQTAATDGEALRLGVQLATTGAPARVDERHLPWIAERAARAVLADGRAELRGIGCAVVIRFSGDRACAEDVMEAAKPHARPAAERARAWRVQRQLGAEPALLASDWEREVRGAAALEMGAWVELPPSSRVRLLEPLLASGDVGDQIAALVTLQTVPGPEALAVFTRLAGSPPSFVGARTLVTVGLARHGNREAIAALAPVERQLSAGDRLALAVGRLERRDPAGRMALVDMVNTGAEPEALRAAEVLAGFGPEPRVVSRILGFVRDVGPGSRARWLDVAGAFGLGDAPDVVRHTVSDDAATRAAAALAVAIRSLRPPSRLP
jgi:hypothetical protein